MRANIRASLFAILLAAVMSVTVISPAQSFLTNGLVAYYPFNGNAKDFSVVETIMGQKRALTAVPRR